MAIRGRMTLHACCQHPPWFARCPAHGTNVVDIPDLFAGQEHGRQVPSVVGAKLLMGVSSFEAKRMQGRLELSDK